MSKKNTRSAINSIQGGGPPLAAAFTEAGDAAAPANLSVTFNSGLGHMEARLFRGGPLVDQGSLDQSGDIPFASVQSGDMISINGICSGTTVVTIAVPTDPATPISFPQGNFHHLFMVN